MSCASSTTTVCLRLSATAVEASEAGSMSGRCSRPERGFVRVRDRKVARRLRYWDRDRALAEFGVGPEAGPRW